MCTGASSRRNTTTTLSLCGSGPSVSTLVITNNNNSPLINSVNTLTGRKLAKGVSIISASFLSSLNRRLRSNKVFTRSNKRFYSPLCTFLVACGTVGNGCIGSRKSFKCRVRFPCLCMSSSRSCRGCGGCFMSSSPCASRRLIRLTKCDFSSLGGTTASLSVSSIVSHRDGWCSRLILRYLFSGKR